jgi:DNA-binding response OmpR family regulator
MGSLKVLLVSHDPDVAQVRKSLLNRQEIQILTSTSGVDAYNKVKFDHPELAVIDIALHDVSGDEVCRDIKNDVHTRGTIVALLIDSGDDWFASRAREAGADLIFHKPLQVGDLEKTVAKILSAPLRKALRVVVRVKVDGASGLGEMRGESVDISSNGMQFQMSNCELEKGYSLWLKFQLADDQPAVVCKAEVVRVMHQSSTYRVGVQFSAFNGDGAAVLRKFLREKGASDTVG